MRNVARDDVFSDVPGRSSRTSERASEASASKTTSRARQGHLCRVETVNGGCVQIHDTGNVHSAAGRRQKASAMEMAIKWECFHFDANARGAPRERVKKKEI